MIKARKQLTYRIGGQPFPYIMILEISFLVLEGVCLTMRILLVDDEKKITTVLKAYLHQEGFQVTTAINGLIALTMFKKNFLICSSLI